jgi:hypothetical protein
MAYVIAIVAGLAYGAADQYLGSLRPMLALGSWAPTAAQVSAPWLLVPFLLGATQPQPRRAMLVGLVTTQSALLGYFAMTLSPLEGVPLGAVPAGAVHLLPENGVYIVAGLATGLLFGLLGHRWRLWRSWSSAALFAGVLFLEPWARAAVGRLPEPSTVWIVEVGLGLVVSVYFAWRLVERRRASRTIA